RGLRRTPLPRVASVTQDDEAVRDLLHLLEEVGDVDDRVALSAEPGHQVEEPAGVFLGEAARGLVEDEDAAAHREGARDLHELLGRHGERSPPRLPRDLGAPAPRAGLPRAVPRLAPAPEAPTRR